MIVLDSLIRFYTKGVDENKSTDMSPVMSFLRSLVNAGATVLVLHHKGKGTSSEYRGSSDILGGVDISYTIKKPESGSSLVLKCIKSRFGEEKDIPVEVYSDDTSFRFEDATQRITRAKEQEEVEKSETIKSIIEDQENPNQSTVIKTAKEMGITKNETRELLKKGAGKYWETERGKNNKISYKSLIK